MTPTILATSFRPWLPHQPSNSSDDLLALLQTHPCGDAIVFLRQLPVDTDLASREIDNAIRIHQPRIVLCCGMAEQRRHLNLERYARNGGTTLATPLSLDDLVQPLPHTRISHDAGTYVCNDTYYRLLHSIQRDKTNIHALFIHVPILTALNQVRLLSDLCTLVEALKNC
ncbi:MAG: peptidase C15 [Cyanobacteria bacterium P01_A01_bin.3]